MSCGAYIVDSARVRSETRDGDALVVDLADGGRFRLAGSGPALWALLPAGRTLEELVAGLARQYDAPAAEIRAGIEPVLDGLAAGGLLTRVPEVKPLRALPDPVAGSKPPFEPPRLEPLAA